MGAFSNLAHLQRNIARYRTHDTSLIDCHVKDVETLGTILNNAAAAAFPRRGLGTTRYSAVYVLLLYWEDDDLGVVDEIDDLEAVFRDIYGYTVDKWKIPSNNPHNDLAFEIISALRQLQSPDKLFIVYYGGHAPSNRQPGAAKLQWSSLQTMLEEAECDVLVLLDCCAAGSSGGTQDHGRGVTEVIAACGFEAIAPPVGEHSFTRSLIEELKYLSQRYDSISTVLLHNKVLARIKTSWNPRYASENPQELRRTPIHIYLSEDTKQRCIRLTPLIHLTAIAPESHLHSSSALSAPLTPPSEDVDMIGTERTSQSSLGEVWPDREFALPKVLISVALQEDQYLNVEDWSDWVLSVPGLAKYVHIEGVFKSDSTLLLLSLPVALWDMLQNDPAISFLAFVRSRNFVGGSYGGSQLYDSDLGTPGKLLSAKNKAKPLPSESWYPPRLDVQPSKPESRPMVKETSQRSDSPSIHTDVTDVGTQTDLPPGKSVESRGYTTYPTSVPSGQGSSTASTLIPLDRSAVLGSFEAHGTAMSTEFSGLARFQDKLKPLESGPAPGVVHTYHTTQEAIIKTRQASSSSDINSSCRDIYTLDNKLTVLKRLRSAEVSRLPLIQITSQQAFLTSFGRPQLNMQSLPRLSIESGHDKRPQQQPAVYHDSAEEEEASRHQVLWANTMLEGRYQNPSLYDKVEVLLLCWRVSDMDASTEVKDLLKVFEEDFGYHATTEYLDANSKLRLQVQLNARVARFVCEYDGPKTLFIVYYAGHGMPGEALGDLQLAGQISLNDPRNDTLRERNRLVWNKTEELLRPADADVLEIFDCCYAGTLGLFRGENRMFEYLAATKDQGMTPVPGPNSFTSALIYSLKALLQEKKEGRFTTDELLRKIKTDAPDFPKDQAPVMSNRDNKKSSAGRIMLHPLRQHRASSMSKDEESHVRAAMGYVMTLHFHFEDKPPDDHLITLGRNLNKIFERNTFGVQRVRWGGLRGTPFTIAAQKFREGLIKRRASSQGQRPKMALASCTPTTVPLNTDRLSLNLVDLDHRDTGTEDSGSTYTSSSPSTPSENIPQPPTKDGSNLVEVVGDTLREQTLETKLGEAWRVLRALAGSGRHAL
ncbi:MAG: hypothetical protein Q9169_007189 [Polycauliona sp. 2 TL-2023]